MKTKTLAQVKKDLQAIANQHGETGFAAAKTAYFKSVIVTDDTDDANVLSLDQVDAELEIEFPETGNTDSKSNDSDGVALKASDLQAAIDRAVKAAIGSTRPDSSKALAGAATKAHAEIKVKSYRPRFMKSAEACYDAGQWLLATIGGSDAAAKRCADRGVVIQKANKAGEPITTKGHIEGSNAVGGWLVPEQIDAEMINLLENYGVFRRNSRLTTMTSDTLIRRRLRGGPTMYFVGEAQAGTESTLSWDKVGLTAKKTMGLSTISNELSEDAAMSVADQFVEECARAQSQLEDQCGFIGDGTSTYGTITGLFPKVYGLNGTVANIQALQVQTGTGSFSGLTLNNFYQVQGRIQTKGFANARWYMNPSFYAGVARPLLNAQSDDLTQVVGGITVGSFLGYPVEFVEVMPFNWEINKVFAWFGNLSLASMFGDRRNNTIGFSDSALNSFENDETAVRMTCRFDINIHDVGTAHATASSRVKGPIAGLISAAS